MRHFFSRKSPTLGISIVMAIVSAATDRSWSVDEPLREPSVMRSERGVLDVRLVAERATIRVGDQPVTAPSYNGYYLPPTLHVRPGDVIRINLVNRLESVTNLHTHGLSVSPRGSSDNIYRHVMPNDSAAYEIHIPKNHAAGLFWYHPHPHPGSDFEVRAGMAGALVVDGLLDSIPALQRIRERVLLLKAIQLENGRFERVEIGKNAVRSVNGQVRPVIAMQPGETQLWRIANISSNLYYTLRLDGHRFGVIATDGHLQSRVVWIDTLILSPASRAEVLVQGGAPGNYVLATGDIDTGPAGNQYRGAPIASVAVNGTPAPPMTIPTTLVPVHDISRRVTNHRTVVYSESKDGNTFYIDGKTFDPDRIDIRIPLGAVEEWTIQNQADELHNFHIHQTPFLVTEINGVRQPIDGYHDIVDVPIRGVVKVVIAFTNPVIVGRFPFHCHLLSHEDKGMMANIEVVARR